MAIPKLKRSNPTFNRIKASKINKTVVQPRMGLDHSRALTPINVHHTQQFFESQTLLHEMVNNLNRNGTCLININGFDNSVYGHRQFLKQNLLDLKPLFGGTAFHQKSEKTGILTIDPRTPNSVNVANTHIDHPPHTDGAFEVKPEKIVCLAAEHSCKANEGLTTLICGQSMLQWVLSQIGGTECDKKQMISALFFRDAIEIGRTLPTNGSNEILNELRSNQSVLSYLFEYDDCGESTQYINDNLRLIYRYGGSYVKHIRSEVKNVWEKMTEYCDNKENIYSFKLEPGQVLLIDNTSYLHGRTPYCQYRNLRVLHRLNFFHTGLLQQSVRLGINKDVLHNYRKY